MADVTFERPAFADDAAAPTTRDPSLDVPRELKVRIPTRLHLMLHIAKVRSGTSIADLLSQALSEFFERNPDLGRVPDTT